MTALVLKTKKLVFLASGPFRAARFFRCTVATTSFLLENVYEDLVWIHSASSASDRLATKVKRSVPLCPGAVSSSRNFPDVV